MLKAAVSGSFHRHMAAIYTAVNELRAANVQVLSPSDPRVVDHLREFLFVASDRTRFKKQVQQRHFEAIENSNFLWLVCPDGYVGTSASMEIGWALRAGVPIFSEVKPFDVTVEDFVSVVPSLRHAIASCENDFLQVRSPLSMLIDPTAGMQAVIKAAERSEAILTGRVLVTSEEANKLLSQDAQVAREVFVSLDK